MGSRAVLLIEDNQDDEELILLALGERGLAFEISVVRDGVEALDYLFGTGPHSGRDTSSQPILVLLDLKMPKLGGLDVLERLRADPRTSSIPVVVLTSSMEARDIEASYRLGANSYVCKPVEFDSFVHTLRRLGLYWMRLNQAAGE